MHEDGPRSIADLLASRSPKTAPGRATERGELLRYFSQKTGRTIKYIAFRVTGLSVRDLYYIKSSCDQYEKSGNPWAKGFFGSLKK